MRRRGRASPTPMRLPNRNGTAGGLTVEDVMQGFPRSRVVAARATVRPVPVSRSRVALLPPGRQLVACTRCLSAPGHPQPHRLWGVGHELAAFEEAHQIVTPNGSDVCE